MAGPKAPGRWHNGGVTKPLEMAAVYDSSACNTVVRRAYGRYRHGQLHYHVARPITAVQAPFMALHMSPSSGRIYRPLLARMGGDRLALAPDTPGFGESDVPPAPLEIQDFARANFALLDQLGVQEPVDVMGYHTGAMTATEMALLQPARVRRLVLVSAPIFTDEELAQFRAHYGEHAPAEDGAHLLRTWQALRHWRDPQQGLQQTTDDFAEHFRGGANAWWGHRAAFNYRLETRLPDVAQPLLVLNPDDDLHTHTLRAQGLLRNGSIRHLPGWSHGFLAIRPAGTAAMLRAFLDA